MAHATRTKRSNESFNFDFDFADDRVGSETIGTATVVAKDSAGVDRSAVAVDTPTFEGLGLDDMTSGGTYSGTADSLYTITIDAIGAPDTFSWSRDGGAVTAGVSITGSAQTLDQGVTVTFAATTGHALNDNWQVRGTAAMVSDVADATTIVSAQLKAGRDGMDYEVTYSAPMSGTPADTWTRVLLLKVRDSMIGSY
jgi:hypothetical protein